jgi:hypothetical protein
MASKANRKPKIGTARAPATVTRLPTNSTNGGAQRVHSPPMPPASTIASTVQSVEVSSGRSVALASGEVIRLRELPACALAAGFLAWLREHGLSRREWTVDDLWFLVEEDFAVALGFALPPRRVFLGALQKLAGVQVQYDRRVYDRQGNVLRKTTFYRFAPMAEAELKVSDPPPLPLAA